MHVYEVLCFVIAVKCHIFLNDNVFAMVVNKFLFNQLLPNQL